MEAVNQRYRDSGYRRIPVVHNAEAEHPRLGGTVLPTRIAFSTVSTDVFEAEDPPLVMESVAAAGIAVSAMHE